MLLVTEAHEASDWEFNGHVDAPEFVAAMRHALGEESAAEQNSPVKEPRVEPEKKKHGFWAGLKGLFVGRVEAASPKAGVY
jgi:hypothetical protein